jgi:hypothetical protein
VCGSSSGLHPGCAMTTTTVWCFLGASPPRFGGHGLILIHSQLRPPFLACESRPDQRCVASFQPLSGQSTSITLLLLRKTGVPGRSFPFSSPQIRKTELQIARTLPSLGLFFDSLPPYPTIAIANQRHFWYQLCVCHSPPPSSHQKSRSSRDCDAIPAITS